MKKLITVLLLLLAVSVSYSQKKYNNQTLSQVPELNKWFVGYNQGVEIESYVVRSGLKGHYDFMTEYDKILKFYKNPSLLSSRSTYRNMRVENFTEFRDGELLRFHLVDGILIAVKMDKDLFILSILDTKDISEYDIKTYINNL